MEQVEQILTNPTFWSNTPSVILLIIVLVLVMKLLKVKVNTSHIQIGGESAESWTERKILQEQSDFAHEYLMGLTGKITALAPDGKLQYDGWFTRCILEDVYDEVVRWITYNHIVDNEAYISTKQNKICALIYKYNILPPYRTPEFQERVKRWVQELILELVRIRKVYKEQMKK